MREQKYEAPLEVLRRFHTRGIRTVPQVTLLRCSGA
jgi:hypothetical protein